MSIDTGSSLSYDKNFPVANIKQSSKQFRDNFAIIKTAVENLQLASSSNTSVLTANTVVSSTGQISINLQFTNNSFKLPSDTSATTAGLIRYNSSSQSLEFYSDAWHGVVAKNANGSVSLTDVYVSGKLQAASTPTANTDVVNLEFLNAQLTLNSSNTAAALALLTNAVAYNNTAIYTEITNREAGDTNLQNQIDIINNAISSTQDANVTALQQQMTQNAAYIRDVENAMNLGDNNLWLEIQDLKANVFDLTDTSFALSSDLVNETAWRIANDALLANSILVVSDSLTEEANTRSAADNAINQSLNYVNTTLTEINADISSINSNVSYVSGIATGAQQLASLVATYYSRVFYQEDMPDAEVGNFPPPTYITNGSIWIEKGNGVNYFHIYDEELDNGNGAWANIQLDADFSGTVLKAGDTMTGALGMSNTIANVAYYISVDPLGNPVFANANGYGAYLDVATGLAANTRILTTVDGFVDFSNTTVRFPDSNVIIDADHYLLFQGIPNQVGGNDGGGIVFESTNLDYAHLSATYFNAINNCIAVEMAANGALTASQARTRVAANAAHMANSYPTAWTITNAATTNLEFGLLRIFTTNDFDNGVNNDSMALEPAASLYLNPGWSGGGQEQTSPVARTAYKTNAQVVIGNAVENVVTFYATTGDMVSKGNISAPTGNFTNVNVTNGALTLTGSQFYLPKSNITIDAGYKLNFESLPNQAGGAGDGGFIIYEANNFDYTPPSFLATLIGERITGTFDAYLNGNGVAVANTFTTLANAQAWTGLGGFEYSCLRIGTTNDPGGTGVADSLAIEPAADLYLNPGWSGSLTGRSQFAPGDTYGGSANTTIDVRNYSNIVVGNATQRVLTINAGTGNMWTKGNIIADGNISGLSDQSVKDDLVVIPDALEKVKQITGYTYTRIDLPNRPTQMGVIAQDVEKVAPEIVHLLPSGLKSVSYGNLNALLIEAIKKLAADKDAMAIEIAALRELIEEILKKL